LHEGEYVAGKEFGPWKSWYENGNLNYAGSFNEGLKNGEWKGFYINGTPKYIINYKNINV
jgi:antitoxin component YwqK of YwqJK toxin-antitoxin module